MATNKVSFYYRKDLNVTKHGEFKAAATMPYGSAVKRNEVTKQLELAANSAAFEGIADKILLTVQGNDNLSIASGERCRIGVGKDYEFVVKGLTSLTTTGLVVGDEVEVLNGVFKKKTTDTAVGKVVDKFANGEIAIRIY